MREYRYTVQRAHPDGAKLEPPEGGAEWKLVSLGGAWKVEPPDELFVTAPPQLFVIAAWEYVS